MKLKFIVEGSEGTTDVGGREPFMHGNSFTSHTQTRAEQVGGSFSFAKEGSTLK